MSVLSFPERGEWGDKKWRGNCSGYVYRHLFNLLTPRTMVDPMVGSGTSVQVAEEMGIEALGLDLHSGFDILKDRIRDRLPAHWNGADLVLSHPPYLDIVRYSGSVWGSEPHPADLSHVADPDEFLELLAQGLLNQRDATREGGVYGVILGDVRRKGEYHALPTDLQSYLPRRERRAILIKAQHNVQSESRSYGKLRYGRIEHETILLYERLAGTTYYALACAVQQQNRTSLGTWRAIIRHAITTLGAKFTLKDIYAAVYDAAPERVKTSLHWQAKVRQTLQQMPDVTGEGSGVWLKAA